MTKTLEEMAEEWACIQFNREWASDDEVQGFIAGAKRGLEMAEIVAKDNGYFYSLDARQPFAEEFNTKLKTQRNYIAEKIRALMPKGK